MTPTMRTDRRGGRVLSGPESIRAAFDVAAEEASRNAWPYYWKYPPPAAIRRMPQASIVMPAVATQTVILAFTIPTGFTFVWSEVLLTAQAPAYVPGSGDLAWVLDLDKPLTTAPLSGSPLADFQSITFPLGSLSPFSTCKLPKAEILKSGQTIRAKVTNAALPAGAPNFLSAMFLGWLMPSVR
jgi:hypothetical protein